MRSISSPNCQHPTLSTGSCSIQLNKKLSLDPPTSLILISFSLQVFSGEDAVGEVFSGGDDCFCEEVHCCLGCSYSYSVSGLTNYCIAVNWYYLAPFWVDSLLWYVLAEVMIVEVL